MKKNQGYVDSLPTDSLYSICSISNISTTYQLLIMLTYLFNVFIFRLFDKHS